MAGRKREAWNDEDTATLKRMFLAGAKTSDIARALERTEAAIDSRIVRMKRFK